MNNLSDAVIRRLPSYYRHLVELENSGTIQISSKELGDRMQLTPSQIRQDINSFGGFGRQGYGYSVHELKEHLREIMGLNREHRMVIMGAGRIGRAIANYVGFGNAGYLAVALFDPDPNRQGRIGQNIPVFPMEELEKKLPGLYASIAVLALPEEAAQETLNKLYSLGIRGFWNFAPVDLNYPPDATVVNVHLIDSLFMLGYRMNHSESL